MATLACLDVLDIAGEVEVSTKRRKTGARKNHATPRRRNTRSKRSVKATGRAATRSHILTAEERRKVVEIDRKKLKNSVIDRAEHELCETLFPERVKLWQYIQNNQQLEPLITYTVDRYLKLYETCSSTGDPDAELFLKWLDIMRSLTCDDLKTDETRKLLQGIHDNCDVSKATKQSLTAIILNAIYLELRQQMADEVEQVSIERHVQTTETELALPSDDVSLHRICGWALKSTIDHFTKLSKATKELELARSLKLPLTDKHLLPKPVQYLDRGGLTFLRLSLCPWMKALELKLCENLNQRMYRLHGSKIFKVTHEAVSKHYALLHQFQAGIVDSGIQPPSDVVGKVHNILVEKVSNARCNEFLQSIGKLGCIDNNKVVDGNVSLRDELKVYAINKTI